MPPIDEVLIGLLMAAIVAAFIATGTIAGRQSWGDVQRDKSPRTFWAINALFAAWAAYLILSGISGGALAQIPTLVNARG
jgi:hypothetical protein